MFNRQLSLCHSGLEEFHQHFISWLIEPILFNISLLLVAMGSSRQVTHNSFACLLAWFLFYFPHSPTWKQINRNSYEIITSDMIWSELVIWCSQLELGASLTHSDEKFCLQSFRWGCIWMSDGAVLISFISPTKTVLSQYHVWLVPRLLYVFFVATPVKDTWTCLLHPTVHASGGYTHSSSVRAPDAANLNRHLQTWQPWFLSEKMLIILLIWWSLPCKLHLTKSKNFKLKLNSDCVWVFQYNTASKFFGIFHSFSTLHSLKPPFHHLSLGEWSAQLYSQFRTCVGSRNSAIHLVY